MIVIANPSLVTFLQKKIEYLSTLEYRLFQNDITPTGTTLLGAFTEADFDGYDLIVVDSWGPPFLNGDNLGETDADPAIWTSTGTTSNDIYGYYVTLGGVLIFSDRNASAPVTINAVGQTYTVLPKFLEATYTP